ncbi:hypothetical protein AAG570_002388 [Ranatra chinensis]|uniref:Uncharacterized protein n=1 Tax=Ranatra chinensis TaxID=642074 RepID=A0ABD0Y7T5_9HEMI
MFYKNKKQETTCGPTLQNDMVSRRRILSRSRDDLNLEMSAPFQQPEEEEDVWFNKDKLYKNKKQETTEIGTEERGPSKKVRRGPTYITCSSSYVVNVVLYITEDGEYRDDIAGGTGV